MKEGMKGQDGGGRKVKEWRKVKALKGGMEGQEGRTGMKE
jgi:hypothetical protein